MTTLETLSRIQTTALRTGDVLAYEDYLSTLLAYKDEDKAGAYRLNEWLRTATAEKVREGRGVERFYLLNKQSYLFTARDNFEDFMIYCEWDREPEKRFYIPRRKVLRSIVHSMQQLVDDELDILGISLPPGTGKTTLQIFLHAWMVGRDPEKLNLASGHSGTLTSSIYDGVCSILQDKQEYLWADVFPERTGAITNAKETTIDVDKKHRFSSLTCRAIGATLTGATRCEGLLTADDLVSGIEEALSKDRLDKKWEAYNNDLKSRKKLGAKELHLSTRWSVHDVIGRLERQYEGNPRAKFIAISALNEQGESNFNYKYGVGFDTKYFEDMQDSLDDVSFRALYMNQPIEREGLLYHPDDLRRYYDLPEGDPDAILAICDTAEGGGDDVFLPVGYVYGQDHYIEDCVCDPSLPEITDAMCVSILLKHKVKMCRFESNSAGGRTADHVQEALKTKGGITHITKKRTTANKETKIIVNSAWVKEHCLFKDSSMIKKGSDYAKMMNRLCAYTHLGKNKRDDVPDGMAQYAEFVQSLAGNAVEVMKRPF